MSRKLHLMTGERTGQYTVLRVIGVEDLGESRFVFLCQNRQVGESLLLECRHNLVGDWWDCDGLSPLPVNV